MAKLWSGLLSGLLDLIFPYPAGCQLCGRGRQKGICDECWAALRCNNGERACARCGRFFPRGIPYAYQRCLQCRRQGAPFLACRAAGPYEGLFKEAVYKLKYQRRRSLASPMARLMWSVVKDDPLFQDIAAVVPVPISPGRLRERRFNQAGDLAREICNLAGWTYAPVVIKNRDTRPQTGLTRAERADNLRGAFTVTHPRKIRQKTVLVVDDVYTTGSTLKEMAGVLRSQGAEKILGLTFAAGRLET
ncbi:MAG: ComF family protein [Peptococcaceae bacterium]|nr:ComF family protein [Peptococcaceae bacterium]